MSWVSYCDIFHALRINELPKKCNPAKGGNGGADVIEERGGRRGSIEHGVQKTAWGQLTCGGGGGGSEWVVGRWGVDRGRGRGVAGE